MARKPMNAAASQTAHRWPRAEHVGDSRSIVAGNDEDARTAVLLDGL
jgi:hypothetical protein